jgi:hypothetical protein
VKTNLTWFGWAKCVFMLSMLLPAPVAGRKAEAFQPAPAQTEVMLPAPTGPHKTGRASFHWKDSTRAELETSAPDDKRELMVHLFYPADAKAAGAQAVYVPDADVMRPPWNEAQQARITAMRAYSRENAPLQRGKARYPVVIFFPGGGMKALTYHTLLEDLASHGWIVAAIDPPYNARAMRFPDGRVLGALQPNERGWPQPRNGAENQRFYRERVAHWARDIGFVIDQLTALDKGKGAFANRLDLKRGVGAFGHSRGGQAASTVRLLDPRVRGAVNLDGTAGDNAVIPVNEGDTSSGAQPFLWVQRSLPPPPTDEQLQRARRTRAEYDARIQQMIAMWHRKLGDISGGALRVYIDRPGIQHIDFSDEPHWDGTMTAASRSGRLQTIADTRAWVRAFFDGAVRGEWASLKRLANDKSQMEVTVHQFGRMWPQ